MARRLTASLHDDLLGPQYLQDPYPIYRRLREEDPVHWFEPWNAWILTRYSDVVSVLREDGKKFSVVGRVKRAVAVLPTAVQEEMAPALDHFSVGLVHSDPPDHSRIRRLISAAFTPRSVAESETWIQELVDQLLDGLAGREHFDLVGEFAFPLPALVVGRVLGMPPEDRFKGKKWADANVAFFGSNRLTTELARHGQSNLLEARAYLGGLAAARREAPGDDVISRLVAAKERGESISDSEILSTVMTFLLGGHETTTALITSGLLSLCRFPNQLERLRTDLSLIPAAAEEILRYESPNQRILRVALEDVELGDKEIKKGQSVMLLLGAANRDPDQFPDPDDLDIGRNPNKQVAFALGIHACIGASLARLEGEIALKSLLERYPRLEIEAEPEWIGNPMLRLLRELPVRTR
jgi:cytochrome P450